MSSNMTKELNLKICTNQKLKSTPKKNLENLGQSKPGQAFKVLKHLRAQPGDPVDNSTLHSLNMKACLTRSQQSELPKTFL